MRQIITNQSFNASDDIFLGNCGLPEATTYHNTQAHGFFAHFVKGPTGTRQRSYRIDHLPVVGEFKQTTDLFHRILIDDKAQTSSALPYATAVGVLFDEYRKFQLI